MKTLIGIEYITINDLSKFDQDYLRKNRFFSTLDIDGNDRNDGQEMIGRVVDDIYDGFELVITAITNEILRRTMRSNIPAWPTYQINEFVLVPSSQAEPGRVIAMEVIDDFIQGQALKLQYESDISNI